MTLIGATLISLGDVIFSCAGVDVTWCRIPTFNIAAGYNCLSPWV